MKRPIAPMGLDQWRRERRHNESALVVVILGIVFAAWLVTEVAFGGCDQSRLWSGEERR